MKRKRIPLKMFKDSEGLFRVIMKSSLTTEKRLMVYIRSALEAYEHGYISEVRWIRSSHNISDGLTKFFKLKALSTQLDSSCYARIVGQYVVREDFQREQGTIRVNDDEDISPADNVFGLDSLLDEYNNGECYNYDIHNSGSLSLVRMMSYMWFCLLTSVWVRNNSN